MNSRIKAIREVSGKSQKDFGESLGCSRDVYANYEYGRVTPTDTFLKLLVAKYNVDETWLRTGEGKMFRDKDKRDRLMEWAAQVSMEDDTDRRRIVEALMTLKEDQWAVLADVAKKIVGEK